MKLYKLTLIVIAISLLSSCHKKSTEPVEVPEVSISDNTVVIDTTELSDPIIEGDNYAFTFTGEEPDIYKGDIIIGQTNGGYLRKVTGVSIQGNNITLTTTQAALTDIIEHGAFRDTLELAISPGQNNKGPFGMEVKYLADGVTVIDGGISLDGITLFSGSVGAVDLTAIISSGYVQFEPIIDIGGEISWFTITEFHAIATGEVIFDCNLEITSTGEVFHESENTIAEFSFGPFVQFIGPVPVIEIVNLEFTAGYETDLNSEGEVGAGFDLLSSVSIGAEYQEENWSSVWDTETLLTTIQFPGALQPMLWRAGISFPE